MVHGATVAIASAVFGAAAVMALPAQSRNAGTKSVMNDITVKADAVYTGSMELAIAGGKVSGAMHITSPTEIRGQVAGTSKAGVLSLDFPYRMTQRNCDGTVKMTIALPPKPGLASGTMEAIGCGRDTPLKGTVELIPAAPKKPATGAKRSGG